MNLNPMQRLKASRMALYAATAEDLFDDSVQRANRAPPQIVGVPIGGVVNNGDWTLFGQFRADDDVDLVQSLRTVFDLGQDDFFYGLILERQSPDPNGDFAVGDLLAMVRGTGTQKEWLLDACAAPESDITTQHPSAGVVPDGFYSIYKSMEVLDVLGNALGSAAHALADIVQSQKAGLTIVGHSLGAALVAYLTYDVADLIGPEVAKDKLDSYMIACPNPGDRDFAAGFKSVVPSYTVVNWSADLVPKVPPLPFIPLLDGVPAESLQNVAVIEPSDLVIGRWAPRNTPACNHHAVCYARMLDPNNQYAITNTTSAGC
jgi:hypothetical protein